MASLLNPRLLSHGTLECEDIAASRRFFAEFLGLDVVRAMKESQYLSKGGPWSVVCVCIGKMPKAQQPENRFEVCLGSPAEVDAAHQQALLHQAEYGIRDVRALENRAGIRLFTLQDLNGTWWAISNFTPERVDALFEAGDVA